VETCEIIQKTRGVKNQMIERSTILGTSCRCGFRVRENLIRQKSTIGIAIVKGVKEPRY
jgi:hypothetical protein